MWDVIIIGGGPAGISAALYSVSRGKKTLIIEKKAIGGLARCASSITHYSGIIENETGETFSKRLEEQALKANVEIIYDEVINTDFSNDRKIIYTSRGAFESSKVIIANGSTPRRLGISGETLEGMGLNAVKDLDKYKNKNVYVIGGSDGAVKEALFLSKEALSVTIIHFEGELGCIDEFKKKLSDCPNIKLILNSKLNEVVGDTYIKELVIENVITNEINIIKDEGCGVFVYAGSVPNTGLYLDLELENGYIVVNDKMETNISGVYACGDIRVKQVRQIATAVSDGAIAAINACK